jgi:hypothetical protein
MLHKAASKMAVGCFVLPHLVDFEKEILGVLTLYLATTG